MTYILIFNSVHRVMKAEKMLKAADVSSKTIPVPRKLSSDCGLAIRILNTNLTVINAALADEPAVEIYAQENDEFRRIA